MVDLGNGCQRLGLPGIVRSRPQAIVGVTAAMDAATHGRALATGPPAFLLLHACKAAHRSAFQMLLPTSMQGIIVLGLE